MAKKKAAKQARGKARVRRQLRKALPESLGGPPRRRTRPAEQTFPELGNLKDRVLLQHAKGYADEMYEAEEATARATAHKQAIRTRMAVLKASLFTGHGYEFTLTTGEEHFTARKVKRGAKPADTQPPAPAEEIPEDLADLDNGAGESLADA